MPRSKSNPLEDMTYDILHRIICILHPAYYIIDMPPLYENTRKQNYDAEGEMNNLLYRQFAMREVRMKMRGRDTGYGRTEGLACYSQDLVGAMLVLYMFCLGRWTEDETKTERGSLPDHCLRPYRRCLHECSSTGLRYPEDGTGSDRKSIIKILIGSIILLDCQEHASQYLRNTAAPPAFTPRLPGLELIQRNV